MGKKRKETITLKGEDIPKERLPLPKQTETVLKDRRKKRENKGLPKSQRHRLEE